MTGIKPTTAAAKATAEDWVVAATIATEVPPSPVLKSPSTTLFSQAMIIAAQHAVAEVIANRLAASGFPKTAMGVVLGPKQFSAVMRGLSAGALGHRDIWADAMAGVWFPVHVEECLEAWRHVRKGAFTPLVPGALHYFSPVSMSPPMSVPAWLSGKARIPCPSVHSDYFRFYS